MNEGCLWLLGEESSFNMSLERRAREALLEQGRDICEGWCVAGRDRWAYKRVMTMEDTNPQTAFG